MKEQYLEILDRICHQVDWMKDDMAVISITFGNEYQLVLLNEKVDGMQIVRDSEKYHYYETERQYGGLRIIYRYMERIEDGEHPEEVQGS